MVLISWWPRGRNSIVAVYILQTLRWWFWTVPDLLCPRSATLLPGKRNCPDHHLFKKDKSPEVKYKLTKLLWSPSFQKGQIWWSEKKNPTKLSWSPSFLTRQIPWSKEQPTKFPWSPWQHEISWYPTPNYWHIKLKCLDCGCPFVRHIHHPKPLL